MKYLKRIGRLLLDLAVPLLAIGLCIAVYRLGVMSVVERVVGQEEGLVTAVRRIGVIAALFAGYWGVARLYERRRLAELALEPLPTALWAALGAVMIALTLVPLYLLGTYELLSVRSLQAALPLMGTIVLTVVLEEALFRGVIFRVLERHAGTIAALLVQAPAFGIAHLFNDRTTGMTAVSVTLLGAFWTLLFVQSRNLWVVIAHHASWNLTILVSGLPLSGQEDWRLLAPFESGYQGPVWLTGGVFGPEDSILTIVVMSCAVAGLAYKASKGGRLVTGLWSDSREPVLQ